MIEILVAILQPGATHFVWASLYEHVPVLTKQARVN